MRAAFPGEASKRADRRDVKVTAMKTMNEEKMADQLLSQIAIGEVNRKTA